MKNGINTENNFPGNFNSSCLEDFKTTLLGYFTSNIRLRFYSK